jgi:hypothetical protein
VDRAERKSKVMVGKYHGSLTKISRPLFNVVAPQFFRPTSRDLKMEPDGSDWFNKNRETRKTD